jgi:hypothetical protein
MKRILLSALSLSAAFCHVALGQGVPPPGYGVMGVPPPGYGMPPPPSVPAYPNSLPPPTVSAGVTAPPPYIDPYASAPPPGQVSSYSPQGTGAYGAPAPSVASYGAKTGPDLVNFNNLEAFYRYVDPKNKDLDGAHTIGGALTIALFNPLYLKFGASWGSGGGGTGGVGGAAKADYDFASIQAGAGFHTTLINDRLTFVAEAGLIYSSLRATNSALSFSDGSVYIRPALRFTPFDFMEVQAGVTVTSSDRYDSKVLDLSTYFRLMPMFDVGVGADLGDTSRAFRTSLRLRW